MFINSSPKVGEVDAKRTEEYESPPIPTQPHSSNLSNLVLTPQVAAYSIPPDRNGNRKSRYPHSAQSRKTI